MKICAIVQARMGSERLPGKVMKLIEGSTVLSHVIERISQSICIDDIIIATTDNTIDDCIEAEAKKFGVKVFRGSEEDVLSRYYYAAKANNLDTIIRITSDCPLIDPNLIDELIQFFLANDYDIVSNAGSDLSKRTYPRGLDTEVFTYTVLESAFNKATEKYQREHVTPYIYENSDRIFYYQSETDNSKHRWTLDTIEDYRFIREIYSHLYKGKHDFYLKEIISFLDLHSELLEINANIEQKKIRD